MGKYLIDHTASKIGSTGVIGKILISEACKSLLPPLYNTELQGAIDIDGKGLLEIKHSFMTSTETLDICKLLHFIFHSHRELINDSSFMAEFMPVLIILGYRES